MEELREVLPDQIVTVRKPVNYNYEITSYVLEAEKRDANPALIFEKVGDCAIPLLINLFGNVERTLLILNNRQTKGSRLDFYRKWNEIIHEKTSPIMVGKGPVKDVIYEGENVDLSMLPIPKFYEQDDGRYITAGLLVARNPENPEELNLTYSRMQLKGRDRLSLSLHSRGHAWQYLERAKAANKPLEAAVIIGAHPSLYLAAAAKIVDEYQVAGTLLGEPLELVQCETIDVPIPAQAEIVLEGEIRLENEDEGPFTEYTGYISGRSTRNLFQVSSVTMKRDAIFLAVAPSNSSEHLLLSGLPKQARIFQAINTYTHAPVLKDITWPISGTHFICFISLRESTNHLPGLAKQLGLLLLGLDHYVKIVAMLPPEIEVSDLQSVFKAIASKCDFKDGSDVEILNGVYSHLLDPSSKIAGVSSKMIIDVSKPVEDTRVEKGRVTVKSLKLSDVVVHYAFPSDGDRRFCALRLESSVEDLKKILNEEAFKESRLIVCVDDDIDILDCRQILWAIATRFQPSEDAILTDGRMIIDARMRPNWSGRKATLPKNICDAVNNSLFCS
ncbi:UbiD family decarboxylase [Candidatus Bathyarchaeota archaeon]|nr:UbiD family decarboxylase [Candidatus Bathyarchaeota archaeon]